MDGAGLLQLDHLAALEAGAGSGRPTRCFRWNGIGPKRSIYGSCFSGEICCFMSDTSKPELSRRAAILRELIGECKDRHAYRKEVPDLFMDDEPLPDGYRNGALVDPYDDEFMYNELTVQETLAFHNAMRPDASENEQNLYRLVKIMRLNGVLSQPISSLTPDQRRCLTISVELVTGADVIIYDDFTSGLTSIQFADVLSNLKKMLVEYNPSCIIILGVAQLSYDEIMYVDRIQVISNSNAGAGHTSVPTFAKQAGQGGRQGQVGGRGETEMETEADESYFNGSCSMIKAYIRRCHSDSYIYTDSSQNNSRDHDIGTSYDFISIDRTDSGNDVLDAISYGRIVVISVELFRSRAWRLFIGRIDQTQQGLSGAKDAAWLSNDPEPTRGAQSAQCGAVSGPRSTSAGLVEARVDPPSQTVSVDADAASVTDQSAASFSLSDTDPAVSSPIMQHLLPISSAVKINVALPVGSSSKPRTSGAGQRAGAGSVQPLRPLFGRESFNAAARSSTGRITGSSGYSDEEDEEALGLLANSRTSVLAPLNPSLGRARLRWTYDHDVDGRPGRWLVRLATQLYWCCWRAVTIKVRNIGSVLFMWLYVGVLLPVGVILTFSDLSYSQHGFMNRCALLTIMPFVMAVLLNLFFDQQKFCRNITAWDRNRGTHCPAFAMLANTATDLVVVKFIPPVIAAAVFYYPCHLNRSWSAFWSFTEALWVLCLTASCFSRFTYGHMAALSCRSRHLRSSMQFVAALSIMLLYSGIIVYLPSVPSSSLFLRDWSMFYWGCNLLYYNDLAEAEFVVKGHGGQDVVTTGAVLLAQDGIQDLGRARCLSSLLNQASAYLLLALALALLFYRDWSRRNVFSDIYHWLCDVVAL